jgi:pimeloyl-ACP methyl ester carboxylesterase
VSVPGRERTIRSRRLSLRKKILPSAPFKTGVSKKRGKKGFIKRTGSSLVVVYYILTPFPSSSLDMLLSTSFVLALLLTLSCAAASPISLIARTVSNGITEDAAFSESTAALDSMDIECPNGVQSAAGKNILFVHGTGGTGPESWAGGLVSAFYAQGYNGCYISLPNRSLADAQVSGEYVVSAIERLYAMSGNKAILVVGHSQGNLNIQWALNYWPSTRAKVANFVSLSGDFQGFGEAPVISAVQDFTIQGTPPSFIQQSALLGVQSNFLKALNKRGNLALVPTTSLYGLEDEIIQPVVQATLLGNGGAAFLQTSVQTICPGTIVDHFEMLINTVAFYLALDAFKHGTVASIARVAAITPSICLQAYAPGVSDYAIPDTAKQALYEVLAVGSDGEGTQGGLLSESTRVEPALKSYALE